VRLEKFLAALMGLVEPNTVHPGGLLAIVEVREPLVLTPLARVELRILERRDISEQQEIRSKREFVTAEVAAVADDYLGGC
jgi:hypothetical protein